MTHVLRSSRDPVPTRDVSRRLPISPSVLPGLAVGLDSLAIFLAGLFLVRGDSGILLAAVCCFWMIALLLFEFGELYSFDALIHPRRRIDSIVIALLSSLLFLVAGATAFDVDSLSGGWVLALATCAGGSIVAGRLLLAGGLLQLSRQGVLARNIVIAGSMRHVSRVALAMNDLNSEFVFLRGVFVDSERGSSVANLPVLGQLRDIATFIRHNQVDDVIIALPWTSERRIHSLVETLRELPVSTHLAADMIGFSLDFRERQECFGEAPVFAILGKPLSGWGVAAKAIEDRLLALLALALLLPVMMLIAILIKLDSPGPVVFRQKRLGFNNAEFDIYKFRTMRVQTEPQPITIQAKQRDWRVTRIGRILRRSSLDELPQLFNVLNGTMSLVGPRPHAIDHNAEFAEKISGYYARHRVKPGITGWAQVNGLRGETDVPEKMESRVRHDIFYIENWSIFFDLRILARTASALVSGRNAY